MVSPYQVIEHAFAQCAIGLEDLLDLQRITNGLHNGQSRRENRAAFRLDAGKVDLCHVLQL